MKFRQLIGFASLSLAFVAGCGDNSLIDPHKDATASGGGRSGDGTDGPGCCGDGGSGGSTSSGSGHGGASAASTAASNAASSSTAASSASSSSSSASSSSSSASSTAASSSSSASSSSTGGGGGQSALLFSFTPAASLMPDGTVIIEGWYTGAPQNWQTICTMTALNGVWSCSANIPTGGDLIANVKFVKNGVPGGYCWAFNKSNDVPCGGKGSYLGTLVVTKNAVVAGYQTTPANTVYQNFEIAQVP